MKKKDIVPDITKKPILTCTSMDCPERRSLCCKALSTMCLQDNNCRHRGYSQFDCSSCGLSFRSPRCTADKDIDMKRFEKWKVAKLAELKEPVIVNRVGGYCDRPPTGWEERFYEEYCFANFDGKNHYKSLYTNKDQTADVKEFIHQEKAKSKAEGFKEGFAKNKQLLSEAHAEGRREVGAEKREGLIIGLSQFNHPIQEKLLTFKDKIQKERLGYRKSGQLIGEDHPQKVKHHIIQLQKKGLWKN